METVIELENISKSFSGQSVLKDVSFKVEKGSILGFLGPNGAGKTTTVKILLGLLKPDSGRGNILGCQLPCNSAGLKQKIGYIPEKNHFYDYLQVNEIINLTQSFYNNWNDELLTTYLNKFNLPLTEKCGDLSNGQLKQLSLALALASEPELVIMDEPTAGLDPLGSQEFIKLILEELTVKGKTVILASHHLNVIEQIADTVVIINNGQVSNSRAISDLKEKVKKIRVVFQREPDQEILKLPGIEDYQHEGREYLFSISNNLEEIVEKLQQEPLFAFEIIDQDLEEIFIQQIKGGER
jgi:ABC-2 type transport system ATP-binding protein